MTITSLPLTKLGAHEGPSGTINFGLYLPGITAAAGFSIAVKVIQELDQFRQAYPPLIFPLTSTTDSDFSDGVYWSASVDTHSPQPSLPLTSHWGDQGRYVYRYVVTPPDAPPIDWVIDPYNRENGVGDLSAITIGYAEYAWSDNEASWKTPALADVIFYELMIDEFGGDIDGVIRQLDYLQDLGVGCIEVMPVNNVKNAVDWGYDPIGYFGVDERFGVRSHFQTLVDNAHQHGIAVIVDMVFGHTTSEFTFPYLYSQTTVSNPFNGALPYRDNYGPAPDFSLPFAQSYFYTVNQHWLGEMHVDGFRYDNANGYSASDNDTTGFAPLAEATYNLVVSSQNPPPGQIGPNYWNRFVDASGNVNLIQCPEYLNSTADILNQTYANCTWQDGTLGCAVSCQQGAPGAISALGLQLGLVGCPESVTTNGVTIAKTALQYIENHDHSRFVCNFGLILDGDPLLQEGNRALWYMVVPYLIGIFTGKGVPFLWEGQEFCENYFVPNSGDGRQLVFRPVRFSYFYDQDGQSLIARVRQLMKLRNNSNQFKRGEHAFFNVPYYTDQGLLIFQRTLAPVTSIVALNFSGQAQQTTISFPASGVWTEMLDGTQTLGNVTAGSATPVTIPSNYGQIWTNAG